MFVENSFPLILVVAAQAPAARAQHTEAAMDYWYEGVVRDEQGQATLVSNELRPLRQASQNCL